MSRPRKLSDAAMNEVAEIAYYRAFQREKLLSYKALAKKHGVSENCIRDAFRRIRKRFTHLSVVPCETSLGHTAK